MRNENDKKEKVYFSKGIKMVKCERCGGFLVKDSIYNVEGQFLEIEIARCVNCGHRVDLTLLKFKQENQQQVSTVKEEALT